MKSAPPATLRTRSLTKDFGQRKGVFGLDLRVAPGEIVGFIGPNGAGKSTTINLLTGLIRPDKGSIKLFGTTIKPGTIYSLMPRLGILYSEPTIDDTVSARTFFKRNASLLGIPCRENWLQLSRELDLDTGKRISRLSLGNKKKVGIVNALMHGPELLIMDEPTSGLDPLVRTTLLRLLEEFAAGGGSVLLSSHDLGEVQQICRRITMLKDGKVVIDDATEHLLARAARRFRLIKPPAATIEALAQHGLSVIHQGGGELSFQAIDHKLVIDCLTRTGCYDFYVEHPSLAEAFAQEYR